MNHFALPFKLLVPRWVCLEYRETPWDPDGTRWNPRRLRWAEIKTWEPDACRQEPVLYSVPCLVIVSLCGNCDLHGGSKSRPKYEAAKQSPSKVIIINPLSLSSNVETSRASGCSMQLGANRAIDARATLLLERVFDGVAG